MDMTPQATIADLPIDRFERLERAILGDPDVGHLGAIQRLNLMDDRHTRVAGEHDAIDARRIDGDRRIHTRLDEHIEATTQAQARIEKKIDRLWWMLAGSALAGFSAGWVAFGSPPLP